MEWISIKPGENLYLPCTFRDDNGTPINLTGYTITSQVRVVSSKALLASTVVTIRNQTTEPGKFDVEHADTSAWEVNTDLAIDIKIQDPDGRVRKGSTLGIRVEWTPTP